MFRIEIFLNELLEKVQRAELLLANQSFEKNKPKRDDMHKIK